MIPASPALKQAIATHASDRGVKSARDTDAIHVIARDLGVEDALVQQELTALFADGFFAGSNQSARELMPVAQRSPSSANAFTLLAQGKSMASTKRWDPIGRLPHELQGRLSLGDVSMIKTAIGRLQQAVREAKLDFIPVFGYLSLRTNNFAELGKKSQDDVVAGTDVIGATLHGFDIDVVASSVFRGTPEHPGAVAGLGRKAGRDTPGVVLKVPLHRAEELLAVLFARELFAEGDLHDHSDGTSNAMYAPIVENIELADGRRVPGLVFATNDHGSKSIDNPALFGEAPGSEGGLTVERMAYFFAGHGGFIRGDGKAFGGPSVDYWEKSYLAVRAVAGQPIDPKIAAAIELSKLMPQDEVVDQILARTDRDGRLMAEALKVLFAGAVVPLAIHRSQKSATGGLVRERQGTRGDDAEVRLLARAHELESAGDIKLD